MTSVPSSRRRDRPGRLSARPWLSIAVLASGLLVACSDGRSSRSATPPAAPLPLTGTTQPSTRSEAVRFLARATFGPRSADVDALMQMTYREWVDAQLALPPALHRPMMQSLATNPSDELARLEVWWQHVLYSDDQLRQRVAWSLSQILVISDIASAIDQEQIGVTEYYDLLVQGAFGNYRDLLEDVTRSPLMGAYLSMLQNQGPDPARNVFPDENYAREIMQLFSIGLKQLNPDGTPKLDEHGAEIPTYDQSVIEGTAHALTGWNFASATEWNWREADFDPMQPWEDYHAVGPKTVVGWEELPGGGSARADLDAVLDRLFAHPNVGPFIGRQLIQRLVTSNPSPEYVARVSAVFDDDGNGVRGNLGAVVRAILLDPETGEPGETAAPDATAAARTTGDFGRVREPLLRVAALWRAFDAKSASGAVNYPYPEVGLAQAPLRAPSVFNFYRPDYTPPGELDALGLVAPELQLATHANVTRMTNEVYDRIYAGFYFAPKPDTMVLDLDDETLLLETNPALLIEELNLILLGGTMSHELRTVLREYVNDAPADEEANETLRDILYLLVSSAEYALQR